MFGIRFQPPVNAENVPRHIKLTHFKCAFSTTEMFCWHINNRTDRWGRGTFRASFRIKNVPGHMLIDPLKRCVGT